MTDKKDPYASEAETQALLVPDTRMKAERKLAQMMTERGADEQGTEAYPILRQIALELLAEQPAQQEPSEANELLRKLGLDPEQYRTDGGFINHMKVRAAIQHPEEYQAASQPMHQRLTNCVACGRLNPTEGICNHGAEQPAQQQEPATAITRYELLKIARAAGLEEEFLVDPLSEQRFRLFAQIAVNALAPQPAQRRPLDTCEISRLWKHHTSEDGPHHNPYDDDGLGFARAIEAAHNIKGGA